MIKLQKKRILQTALLMTLVTLFLASSAFCGVQMPSFSLPSVVDGKTVSSQEYKGKALLITFFATWCPPCRQEIPTLKKLQDEYKEKGFSVIGLSVDQGGPKVVKKLIEQEKIQYPVLMSNRSVEKGFGGIAGIPTSFLVNKKGNVVRRYPGYVPHALLERDIKSIIQ